MLRIGDVPVTTARQRERRGRPTLGIAVAVERHLRIKASSELWQFTDPDVEA